MPDPDYDRCYQILGLEPGMPLDLIEDEWKLLASAYHPDKFVGRLQEKALKRLQSINNAHDILRKYWQDHGTAPPAAARSAASAPPPAPPPQPAPTPRPSPKPASSQQSAGQSGRKSDTSSGTKSGGAGDGTRSDKARNSGSTGGATGGASGGTAGGATGGTTGGASGAASGTGGVSAPIGAPALAPKFQYELYDMMSGPFESTQNDAFMACLVVGVIVGTLFTSCAMAWPIFIALGLPTKAMMDKFVLIPSSFWALQMYLLLRGGWADYQVYRIRQNPYLETKHIELSEAIDRVRTALSGFSFRGKNWVIGEAVIEPDGTTSFTATLEFDEKLWEIWNVYYTLRLKFKGASPEPNLSVLCYWFEVNSPWWKVPLMELMTETNKRVLAALS